MNTTPELLDFTALDELLDKLQTVELLDESYLNKQPIESIETPKSPAMDRLKYYVKNREKLITTIHSD